MKQNFWFRWRLRRRIKQANRLHRHTGKLYHVVYLYGKLRVFNGKELKAFRKNGKLRADYSAIMLAETEFYNTNQISTPPYVPIFR